MSASPPCANLQRAHRGPREAKPLSSLHMLLLTCAVLALLPQMGHGHSTPHVESPDTAGAQAHPVSLTELYAPAHTVRPEAQLLGTYTTTLAPSVRWDSAEDVLQLLSPVLSKPMVTAKLGAVAPPPRAQRAFYSPAATAAAPPTRRPPSPPQLSILYTTAASDSPRDGAPTKTDTVAARAGIDAGGQGGSSARAWAVLRAQSILSHLRSDAHRSRSESTTTTTATTVQGERGRGAEALAREPAPAAAAAARKAGGPPAPAPAHVVRETVIEVHGRKARLPVTMAGTGVTVVALEVQGGSTLNTIVQLRSHRYDAEVPHDNCHGIYLTMEMRASRPYGSNAGGGWGSVKSMDVGVQRLSGAVDEDDSAGGRYDGYETESLSAFWNSFAQMFDTSVYCESLASRSLRISQVSTTRPYFLVLRSQESHERQSYRGYYLNDVDKTPECQLYVYVEQLPARKLRTLQIVFALVIPLLLLVVPLPFELWRADIVQAAMINIDIVQWMYYPPFLLRRQLMQGCVRLYECVRGCQASRQAQRLQARLAAQQRELATQMESQYAAATATARTGWPGPEADPGRSGAGAAGGWGGWGAAPPSPPHQQQQQQQEAAATEGTVAAPVSSEPAAGMDGHPPSPGVSPPWGATPMDDGLLQAAMEPSAAAALPAGQVHDGAHQTGEDAGAGPGREGAGLHRGLTRSDVGGEADGHAAVSVSSSPHHPTREELDANPPCEDSLLSLPGRDGHGGRPCGHTHAHPLAGADAGGESGVQVESNPLSERAGGLASHELLFRTARPHAGDGGGAGQGAGREVGVLGSPDKGKAAASAAGTAVVGVGDEEEDGERLCRICREDESEGALVAPCACTGSVRWVHRACLDRWRLESAKRNLNNVNRCEICKKDFTIGISRATLLWQGSKQIIKGVLLFFTCLVTIFLITTLSHSTFGELSCLADYHRVAYVSMYSFEGLTLSVFLYLLCLILVLYAYLIVYSWFRSRPDVEAYINEVHVMPPFLTHRNVALIFIVCAVLVGQGLSVGYLLKFFLYTTSDNVWNWEASPFIGGLLLMLIMTSAMGCSVALRDTVTQALERRQGRGRDGAVFAAGGGGGSGGAETTPGEGSRPRARHSAEVGGGPCVGPHGSVGGGGAGGSLPTHRPADTSREAGEAAAAVAVEGSGSGGVEPPPRPQPGLAGDEDYTHQFSIPPDQRVIRAFEYCPPRRSTAP